MASIVGAGRCADLFENAADVDGVLRALQHRVWAMKVRCVKLIDSRGNMVEKSPWLTLGKVYDVLTLTFGTQQKWLLRLVGDGLNGVALFPLDQFEVVSRKIPTTWIVTWNGKGVFEMTAEAWSQPEFWEQFYDGDPLARRTFEQERAKIVGSEP